MMTEAQRHRPLRQHVWGRERRRWPPVNLKAIKNKQHGERCRENIDLYFTQGMAEQKEKKQEGSQRKMKSGDMACFHHQKDMGLQDKTFG